MVKTPRVFVTRRLPQDIETRMSDLFDVVLRSDDKPLTEDELKAGISDCDVFVPNVSDDINANVIAAAGAHLRLIANFGAGTDHIDRAEAYKRNITVTNTPGVLTEDTADLTMALILSVPRRLIEGDRMMRNGGFTGWTPTHMLGSRVKGKSLGIIGMGRIGQAVARRANAFGLSVHYHNRRQVPAGIEAELGAQYHPDIDEMLGAVDIVSLNCPYTPLTHHLINKSRLAQMKPDSFIVNTARGELIDEEALADALAVGQISGAGLDVFENGSVAHSKLLSLENVILTPHIGSATHESRREMGEKVLINIRAMMDHHACPDRVLPPGKSFSLVS
ncbi:MAG: D-glycerate dehydrogenase [Litorimonas sp.]